MSYPTVLWYPSNPILHIYRDRYFEYLKNILVSLDISDIRKKFHQLYESEQQNFILHPDISSLLQSVYLHKSPNSREILDKELRVFFSQKYGELTMNLGNIIPGTDIRLTDSDNNPENTIVNHPDHDQESMIGWWEKSQQEWLDVFSKAFTLLRNVDTGFYEELNDMIRKIVPMKTSIDVHNSCSYKNCIGTLYLGYTTNSLHPELNILEAIIHESSHNKLNLIMQSEPLHVNDYSLKYYSPYRPDARHIHWVLLWVHAIVPTVYVMLSAIEKWYITDNIWYEKILLYHIKNKLWYRVLQKYAKFTEIWWKIYTDIWQVMLLCDMMIKESSQLQNIDFKDIQSRAKQHFLGVQHNYPHLQY